jgi:hypothetical protein
MGTRAARNKSRNRRGQSPSDEASVTSYVSRYLEGKVPLVPSRDAAPLQCVSDPAARRISGAATWDSSLR